VASKIRDLPLLPDSEQPDAMSDAEIPGKGNPVAPASPILQGGQPDEFGLPMGMEEGPAYSPEEVQGITGLVDDLAEKLRPDPIPIPADSLILQEDEEILRVFENYLHRASTFRQPFEDGWMEDWTSYFQKVEGDGAKWRSKIAIPLVYEQVNAFVPVLLGAVDTGYILEIHGMNPEDEQKKNALQTFLEHAFRVKADGLRKLRDGFWYSALFGTGVWRVFWRYEVDMRHKMAPVYEEVDGQRIHVGNKQTLTDVVVADHPDLEVVDIWNFFPAPHCLEGDVRMPYVIERIETTPEQARLLATSGAWGPEAEGRVEEWLAEDPVSDLSAGGIYGQVQSRVDALQRVGLAGPYDMLETGEDHDRKRLPLVVYDLWTPEYRVTVSGDGRKVLGKRPTPFIFKDCPYVVHNFDRIPKCVFGRGIGSVSGPINRMVNFIYNHAADVAQLQRNAPLIQRKGVNSLTSGQIAWQPGTIIPVRDVNDIKPLEVKEVMRDTLLQEQHLIAHADKAVGVNDLLRGQDLSGTSTATEFAGMQNLTRQRQAAHIREANGVISRLGRLWLSMTQQFVSEEQIIRVAGKDGLDAYVQVTPEQVLGEYDVVPAASFIKSNPALLRADSIALTQAIGMHPLLRQDKWIKYMLKVHEVEHPDEFVLPPPEPARDPLREEMALNEGIQLDPSPMEEFLQHLQVHQAQYLLLKAEGLNIPAIHAHADHIQRTLQLMTQVQVTGGAMAGQPGGGAGASGTAAGGGGSTEVERGASREAEAHEGAPGRPPGPISGGRKNP
jgi:hypothetical protein